MIHKNIVEEEINNILINNINNYKTNMIHSNTGYIAGNDNIIKINGVYNAGYSNVYLFTPDKDGTVILSCNVNRRQSTDTIWFDINDITWNLCNSNVNYMYGIFPIKANTPYYCNIRSANTSNWANVGNIQIHYNTITYTNYLYYDYDDFNLIYSNEFTLHNNSNVYIPIFNYGTYRFEITPSIDNISNFTNYRLSVITGPYPIWSRTQTDVSDTWFSTWMLSPCRMRLQQYGTGTTWNPKPLNGTYIVNVYAKPLQYTNYQYIYPDTVTT